MKEYQSLEKDQKELFDKLANAIKENANASDNAQGILTSTNSQDVQKVLGTWLVGHCGKLEGLFTFLTYAIGFGKIKIAQAILENASDDVLKKLLSVESIVLSYNIEAFTALSFAEKKGYKDLAKEIREKMNKLGMSTLDKEKSLDEDDESLGSTRGGCINSTEEFTRRMKESLREDDGSLGSTRGGYTDLAREARETIEGFRVEILGTETQEELKNFHEKNKEMIKEIQTAQAVKIAIFGFVMVALAVAAIATIILTAPVPMTALTITGIVTAGVIGVVGLTVVGFAAFHGLKEIPYIQVEEVGVNNPAQLLRK